MIIIFLIIFYILILYRNFGLIFEFMALKRAPYVAETFAFLSFRAFLNLIIILIKENKKKLSRLPQKLNESSNFVIGLEIQFQISHWRT